MTDGWWVPPSEEPQAHPTRKPRRWPDKFREALRGVKLGVRGHSSFSVHFFFAALAATAGLALECNRYEWCLVIGCVGAVIASELFNSSIETLFRGLDGETKDRIHGCLDISAGAVLAASVAAALVGAIVFGHKLWMLFHPGT